MITGIVGTIDQIERLIFFESNYGSGKSIGGVLGAKWDLAIQNVCHHVEEVVIAIGAKHPDLMQKSTF